MDVRTVGRNIRRIREQRALSQEQLAEKCQLHRTYVSGIERGTRNPSLQNLLKIARALDVHPSILFRDTDGDD